MTAAQYIDELISERDRLDPLESANSIRLLNNEILQVSQEAEHFSSHSNSTTTAAAMGQPELYEEEIVKLVEKIVLPTENFPKFNFVGKIIGPKGSTLKTIVAKTRCKISVLGSGSTRDAAKEEELLQSGDETHKHFAEPLHILLQVEAPRSEAHERLSNAMLEINKVMIGDVNNNNNNNNNHLHTNGNVVEGKSTIPSLAPIIKVGIPPPGAIVLGGDSTRNSSRGSSRGGYHMMKRDESRY